ncbi:hypothetical protein GCM10027275_14750 [Rhabdobacter roseus]|uniref:Glycosyltransferase RgtA/B/C/D-like domain-containing protein n=1 Tax=Rhabdobacter roseus TaxID=1655419 RepID=A0A840TKD0_9BACT|nr:hypothetical protein [Rhabdobacter roseus]MBB5283395.1 hypothetical protein [Rhabdobacter roseus]
MKDLRPESQRRPKPITPATTTQGQPAGTKPKWIFLFIFGASIIVVSRWYYVEQYAVALPFWDQWDAEWAKLLKPWTEGTLRLSDLWAAHNEHRILPTRLLTLLCFELSGSWNNLYEARLNIPLSAVTPLLLLWLLYKEGEIQGVRWLLVAVILAGASLPFSWENILIGFQSQFYFIQVFTLSSLALAVHRPDQGWSIFLILGLSLLSMLTLASGLLTPLAVAAVYGSRALVQRQMTFKSMGFILLLVLMAALAYWTMPYNMGHQALRAENATEFMEAVIRVMAWPFSEDNLRYGVMWLPALVALPMLLGRRLMGKTDLLMLGCLVWTAMQGMALAYGRGHNLLHLPPRYTDFLLLGLAANTWFVLRAPEVLGDRTGTRWGLRFAALFFICALLNSYKKHTKNDHKIMRKEHEIRLIQTENVEAYLKAGDPSVLDKPGFQIPYPDHKRLQHMLDDPGLRKVLPKKDKR